MKYKVLFFSPLGLIPAGQSAVAADMPVKARAPQAIPHTPSWAGFYAGVNVGVLSSRSRLDTLPSDVPAGVNYCWVADCGFSASPRATGVVGGVQVGYNFQSGNFVYGVEADIGLSSAKKTTTGVGNFGYSYSGDVGVEALGTARLRLGYAFDRTLVYATGGLAYGKARDSFQHFATAPYTWSDENWRVGYAAGGGVEYMFNRNWSVKGEAFYFHLGSKDHVSTGFVDSEVEVVRLKDRIDGFVARIGINYLFH
jgi:outer membrane immunogenic protein